MKKVSIKEDAYSIKESATHAVVVIRDTFGDP
jgi:hypothetical protein